MRPLIALAAALFLVSANSVVAQNQKAHAMFSPSQLTWTAGPASLPKGSQVAVLKGNPMEEGIFTIRLKLPANYRIPPHWHPAFENVTVLEGTFSMGLGDSFNEAALHPLGPGGYVTMAPGTRHFAATKEGATIQLHGMGPWQIYYVNAADDPRRPPTSDE